MEKETYARRDFLEIASIGTVLVTIPILATPTKINQESESDRPRIEKRLKDSIYQHLGLTSEQVALHPAFGNHIFAPEHEAVINKYRQSNQPISLIIMENTPSYLGSLIKNYDHVYSYPTLLQKFLNPGLGLSSKDEFVRGHDLCMQFLNSGISIACVDGNIDTLTYDDSKHVDLNSLALTGLVLTTGLPESVLISLLAKRDISRRDLFKLAASSSLINTFFMAQPYLELALDSLPNMPLLAGIDTQSISENNLNIIVEKLFTNPIFVGFYEGLLQMRNEIMALNSWNTIARAVRNNGTFANILLIAGFLGHKNMIYEFLRGPKELEKSLDNYARRLFDKTFEYIWQNKQLELGGKYNVMTGYIDIFLDAFCIGSALGGDGESSATYIPRTARSVVLDALDRKIEELEKVKGEEDKVDFLREFKYRSLNQIIYYNQEMQETEAAMIRTPETSIPSDISYDSFHPDIHMMGFTDYRSSITDQSRGEIGVVDHEGQRFPVKREYFANNGQTITVLDTVFLARRRSLQSAHPDCYHLAKEADKLASEDAVYLYGTPIYGYPYKLDIFDEKPDQRELSTGLKTYNINDRENNLPWVLSKPLVVLSQKNSTG